MACRCWGNVVPPPAHVAPAHRRSRSNSLCLQHFPKRRRRPSSSPSRPPPPQDLFLRLSRRRARQSHPPAGGKRPLQPLRRRRSPNHPARRPTRALRPAQHTRQIPRLTARSTHTPQPRLAVRSAHAHQSCHLTATSTHPLQCRRRTAPSDPTQSCHLTAPSAHVLQPRRPSAPVLHHPRRMFSVTAAPRGCRSLGVPSADRRRSSPRPACPLPRLASAISASALRRRGAAPCAPPFAHAAGDVIQSVAPGIHRRSLPAGRALCLSRRGRAAARFAAGSPVPSPPALRRARRRPAPQSPRAPRGAHSSVG